MFFERIYEEGLAQASYFIGCQASKEALIIDPKRDIDSYLDLAERKKYSITHIAETHIHADFLSGAQELARATGATILLSDEGGSDWQYQFNHKGLKDGDHFMIGNIRIEVLHTPGHTPEHISFLLTDRAASDKASMIFTGDFVFVGDVGRPDLLEEAAGIEGSKIPAARQLFQSLKIFKNLSEFIQVWPGHGAGSACGKSLGAIPTSTVGYEKISNWALRYDDEQLFIEDLLEGQPEAPVYFAMMKKLNKMTRDIQPVIPVIEEISVVQLKKVLEENKTIIDTRDKRLFADSHIPGTINIQNNNDFSNWAGWLLSYKKPFIIISEREQKDEVTRKLRRIGLDNIDGFFCSMGDWMKQAAVQSIQQIKAVELKETVEADKFKIIDVRANSEYNEGHIKGAVHIHLGMLNKHLNELNKEQPVVVYCVSGDRSSTAGSILQKAGFRSVKNLTGGFNAWKENGFEYETA